MFKLASIEIKGTPCVALAMGGKLYEVEKALIAYRRQTGKPLLENIERPLTMLALLNRWPTAFNGLQRLAKFLETRGARPLPFAHPEGRVKFRAPILYPPRIYAAGANYNAHSREMTDLLRPGTPYTTAENSNPYCFLKASIGPVIGHGEKILASQVPDHKIDWEGELGVVVGKNGRNIKKEEARSYIAGYTIVQDVTARSFVVPRRLDFKQDWLMGKCSDTFCPMGPYIVPDAFVEDPERLMLRVTVNDRVMQEARTDDLTHKIADILAFLSQNLTLLPGDVLSTGTPSGVGFARGIFLKPGDVLKTEIEGIGVLENPVA
jgi:2-keto-4-pentenoate hydratase/2-oxohepta-3-ene-1,7-dioic acid hydratase in catechol pathway